MRKSSSSSSLSWSPSMATIVSLLGMLALLMGSSSAQLSTDFYKKTCPNLDKIVYPVVKSAVCKEKRMGASLLRLHFHDCIVQGCDASVLLDDTPTFTGEQTARSNNGSLRGLDVIDAAKSKVEAVCPGVVSCADILTIAARDSVAILGGPRWEVKVGRRDSVSASLDAANRDIPLASLNLDELITRFRAVGLSARDLVALSGAHTIGLARCVTFRARIYNETNINPSLARTRQANCPATNGVGNANLAPLDLKTPTFFDNSYFVNLINKKGLLHSDQVLYNGNSTDTIVETYVKNPKAFNDDFVAAMIRMADISSLTGSQGEIRKNCGKRN